ncbi:hypothetical protein L6452_11969 [Arctium lappa]|uniref:Uncharacterized protein n=1 Tax=Arctium lappa TaxID=4217 RepID=A0ACB9DQ76_ARCLA|nr:hypothetical protein L6452_11969 [Arctium lappa]
MSEASSSSFPDQELAEIVQDNKMTLYSNNFGLEPELYNYYQQPNPRAIDVPLQCPLMIDYQSAGVDNNHGFTQQPFSPRTKLSDWQCQQSFWPKENPKKRMNDVRDQKIANKKLAHEEQMQGIGCVRERVPMRRSQKLADKITALQKLVSPYGKTDTASVLQEAHISIKLLHDQIQEAETGLHNRGLCLVPISTPQINSLCQGKQNFMPRSY